MSLHLHGKCHCSQKLAITTRTLEYPQLQLKSVWYTTVQYLKKSGPQPAPPLCSSAISLRKVLLFLLRDMIKENSATPCCEQMLPLKWNIVKLSLLTPSLDNVFCSYSSEEFNPLLVFIQCCDAVSDDVSVCTDSDSPKIIGLPADGDQLFSNKGGFPTPVS